MKRSERLIRHARREALACAMFLSVAAAMGVWAVVAGCFGVIPGGIWLIVPAAIAFALASFHAAECQRLRGLSHAEFEWERRKL